MNSRMDRIYNNHEKTTEKETRTTRNAESYKKIYDDEAYTNVEGTITTLKNNEIDLEKLKELVLSREAEEDEKNHLVKNTTDDVVLEMPSFPEPEIKNYDIKDALKQAKEESDSRENKYRKLDEEYLDDLKNPRKQVEKIPFEDDIKEIKDLLNTLTSSMELKKMQDADIALDMFKDLKDTQKIDEDPIVKAIIEEAKEQENKKTEDIDNTFNTARMKLKSKDFQEGQEENENHKSTLKIFLIILLVMLLILVGFIGYKLLIK